MDIDLLTRERVLLLDGAMGTMLQKRGITSGHPPELWNLENPDAILDIHRAYVEAGSDIISTNTFQAHELKLESKDLVIEIITAGVRLAKRSGARFTALDVGPLGQLMEPIGPITFEQAYGLFKTQMEAGAAAEADCILIETVSDPYEMKAAILAAKETRLPFLCSMTFQENGRSLTGADPVTAAVLMQRLGAKALGANCSLGPDSLLPVIKKMLEFARVPVIVKPNAGMPVIRNNETIYELSPEDFATLTADMVRAGARIAGGCCGTTPEYIRHLRKNIETLKPFIVPINKSGLCSSGTETVVFGKGFVEIGERLNPTGKKKLKQALLDGDSGYIAGEALAQFKAGAMVLDVNTGIPGASEEELLPRTIRQVQSVVSVPLMLDSANPLALEAAARIYNGLPIINSVNGKKESMDAVLPIAAKYGAMLVCLCLDEDGIPKTVAKRLEIAARIRDEAASYGIPEENLLFDFLTLTVSAEQEQARETILAIQEASNKNLNTILGISNISFGLPSREIINAAFLSAAAGAGLKSAIINPVSSRIRETLDAIYVLNGRDKNAARYIERYAESSAAPSFPAPSALKKMSLKDIVIQGRKDEAASITQALLESLEPLDIINKEIVPALDEVGQKYETGEMFLPQLLMSAQTAQESFSVITALIKSKGIKSEKKAKIILATVHGDIHDIGKNIVKLIMENYGYDIIDLGKDVPPRAVVDSIRENNVKLVGLSALMTTTVRSMAETIRLTREAGLDCSFMVGGAVLTPEYAKTAGADFYAKDAMDGVRIANEFFGTAAYGKN